LFFKSAISKTFTKKKKKNGYNNRMNKTIKLLACSKNEKFYKTSTGKILTKHKLISLIKNNKAIVTTSSGTEVSVIILDGKSFLRTNHNSKEKDNLASALASFEI
jgi:hypothetical protein